jgi:hypothetical protein
MFFGAFSIRESDGHVPPEPSADVFGVYLNDAGEICETIPEICGTIAEICETIPYVGEPVPEISEPIR